MDRVGIGRGVPRVGVNCVERVRLLEVSLVCLVGGVLVMTVGRVGVSRDVRVGGVRGGGVDTFGVRVGGVRGGGVDTCVVRPRGVRGGGVDTCDALVGALSRGGGVDTFGALVGALSRGGRVEILGGGVSFVVRVGRARVLALTLGERVSLVFCVPRVVRVGSVLWINVRSGAVFAVRGGGEVVLTICRGAEQSILWYGRCVLQYRTPTKSIRYCRVQEVKSLAKKHSNKHMKCVSSTCLRHRS